MVTYRPDRVILLCIFIIWLYFSIDNFKLAIIIDKTLNFFLYLSIESIVISIIHHVRNIKERYVGIILGFNILAVGAIVNSDISLLADPEPFMILIAILIYMHLFYIGNSISDTSFNKTRSDKYFEQFNSDLKIPPFLNYAYIFYDTMFIMRKEGKNYKIYPYFFISLFFLFSIASAKTDEVFLIFFLSGGVINSLIIGSNLFVFAKRLNEVDLSSSSNSQDNYVLFLRPFKFDNTQIEPRFNIFNLIPFHQGFWLNAAERTFEEELSDILGSFGPIISLSPPGEFLLPKDVYRHSVSKFKWKKEVKKLLKPAVLVVIVMDYSESMKWEICITKEKVEPSRIVLLLPPILKNRVFEHGEYRTKDWYTRWCSLQKSFSFLPPIDDNTVALLFNENDQIEKVYCKSRSIHKRFKILKEKLLENKNITYKKY